MTSEDEYLERVVAGIHAVSSSDAEVRWNAIINGRQFDVVVRFRVGTLNYLVLIEVKNRIRRASASDVEAFVTKARDQQANKAVFVTSAGYQKGAKTVAIRHGVDLFTVEFDKDVVELSSQPTLILHHNPEYIGDPTPRLEVSEPMLMAVIESTRLFFDDGRHFDLPNEVSQMTYYAKKTKLGDGRCLADLMQSERGHPPKLNAARKEVKQLDRPVSVNPPDTYFFPPGLLDRVELSVAGRMGRLLSGNIEIEPSSFRSPVLYSNVLTGEVTQYSLDQLPLNSDSIQPEHFYFQAHPLRYFYCSSIEENSVTWQLIESFQRAQLIRGSYTQDVKYGAFYVPVTDKAILRRLEGRLQDFLGLPRERAPIRAPGHGFRSPPRNRAKGIKRPKRK